MQAKRPLRLRPIVLLPLLAAICGGMLAAALATTQTAGKSAAPQPPQREYRKFDTVHEAEAYVGFDAVEPQALPEGWRFVNVQATKDLRNRDGSVIDLHYDGPGTGTSLVIMLTPADIQPAIAGGRPSSTTVQGRQAVKDRGSDQNPNLVAVTWRKGGLTIVVSAVTGEDLTEDQVNALMESIR